MGKSIHKHNRLGNGSSHGLRKTLTEAGIHLPCSWRRIFMVAHRDDMKELKHVRRCQGKIRRQYYQNELARIVKEETDWI